MSAKALLALMFGALLVAPNLLALDVDGYCFLEGQSFHQGTRIRFIQVYPGVGIDTIYTDSTGHYQIDLTAGVYNIFYHHYGYTDEERINQFIVMNTTLPSITLETREYLLSGELSGVLDSASWLVTGNISVDEEDSLVILPGTSLLFNGNHQFTIHGCLRAIGQEGDSIFFMPASTANTWAKMYFLNSTSDFNRLEYCVIAGTNDIGIHIRYSNVKINHCSIRDNRGEEIDYGAIYVYYSDPAITNSTISDNVNHGINCYYSNPIIDNCSIIRNRGEDDWYGGGIYGSNSSPIISNCVIKENYASRNGGGIYLAGNGNSCINLCVVENNITRRDGSGIMVTNGCNATIQDCIIRGNYMEFTGGGAGICCMGGGDIAIRRCLISENSIYVWGTGVGIHCANINPVIERCTIVDNRDINYDAEGAIYCNNSNPLISNTIIANNTCLGGVFFFNNPGGAIIGYNCFYNNEGGNFVNANPNGLGQLVTVNANGDSCDIFYNIFLDPEFLDPGSGAYHLQPISPCIDAGDPTSPLDPDSTVADIGAFYYDQSAWVPKSPESPIPSTFQLFQNYPNPFNSATVLRYTLHQSDRVSLAIYNILGQHVITLFNGIQSPGTYSITWNTSNRSSGIYFCRLYAGNLTQTQKMLLMK